MTISEECKAYEKHFQQLQKQNQNPNQGTAFPISKSRLVRYIKYRARNSTFAQFLTNLEQHPKHGQEWLDEMNGDEDIKKLMDLTINLWPRQAKQCHGTLIGIGNVYETPSFEKKFGKYIRDKVNQEAMYRERVQIVEGKKSKGFMVTDPATENIGKLGSCLNSPINLDQPTSSSTLIFPSYSKLKSSSKSTFTSASESTSTFVTTSKGTLSDDQSSTTPTFKPTPIDKYDPRVEEEALREELMQQIRLPSRAKLVSQFKPKSLNKTLSKPVSPSSSSSTKSAKKENQKPSSPALSYSGATVKSTAITSKQKLDVIRTKPSTQKKLSTAQKKELIAQIRHPVLKIEKPISDEECTLLEKELIAQIKHPIVQIGQYAIQKKIPNLQEKEFLDQIKHPIVQIETASESKLWKQAQRVRVIVRKRSGSNGERRAAKIHGKPRTSKARSVEKSFRKHGTRQQRGRILQPLNPVVRILERKPIASNKQKRQNFNDEDEEDKHDDYTNRQKKQKKDHLSNQDKMQIVRVLVKYHSRF
ncbi:hypothetical protein [Parasitella parasitica]|uniref:Uncharacterized protein n=1 Tax=Parasitella parasitica TaxID=35722 RepID=A0A0B7NA98_9FUNG|nr:hypothetical protein [Parasitella parasitica]